MANRDSASLVGRLVDQRYRVESFLAEGGMASVFRAVDTRLDRTVALKVMRPDLARDASFVSRFRREAQAAARLTSPHVVQVYDQGDDGQYVFLAMELVEGETLREVIDRDAPLPIRTAMGYIVPVVRALEVAHRAGMIHRDIKPENVLIGARGQVKVADFGLARAVTSTTMTGNNAVMLGTAAYISPEQVERGVADARSDVYAAGLVLFELLTGEKAFPGDNPITVAYQHVHAGIPDASDLVRLPRAVDATLRQVCAVDPRHRPEDATALLETLEDLVVDLDAATLAAEPAPATVRTGEPTEQLARPAEGRRRAASGTAVLSTTRPAEDASPGPSRRAGRPGRDESEHDPDRAWQRRDRRRRRGRGWLITLLVTAILAVAGGSGGYYWWWYNHDGPGSMTTAPDVARKTRGDAEQLVRNADLSPAVRTQYSEDVPKDQVISASVTPGTSVRRGSEVALVVSQGPERYTVPSLAGKPRDEATAAITAARLTLGAVTEQHDEKVPAGQVISSDPAAGTALKPGAAVRLVLSKGRTPIAVPVVTGQSQQAAVAAITARGLVATVDPASVYSTTVPKGSVVSQNPATGTLFKGDAVTLVISKGPEYVVVPKVTGKSTREAKSALQKAGFVVQEDRVLGGIFETARATDPVGGTKAVKGSTVTLTIV